ncbi:TylF/MycF/NovP-related O-methyltransferase [Paenibacillus sp. sgz5001063]|uniref:TylF/MycF/NovP-related O-methyltransferase n=1 Tax=Paenibacillus sp. sgz5001063 TaxID=3242474 RepID=UPI0036D2C351
MLSSDDIIPLINTKKIVVFGTGQNADILFKNLSYDISYVIDMDKDKWGMNFYGKTIHSPEILSKEDASNIFILLTFSPSGPTYHKISNLLTKMGMEENKHYLSMYYALPAEFPYEEIKPQSNYAPWKTDVDFNTVYNTIRTHTLVDKYRCYELWSLVEQVSKLSGSLIEIGVWKGGTGALIAKKAELCGINERIYLCDTFNGVVKTSPQHDSVYVGGEHSDTSEEIVKRLIFDNMQLNNVKLLKGIFPDDTKELVQDQYFSFCHIDVDAYLSAKDILEWIWDKMVIGGMVVFDDYGFMTCEGITKYVNSLKQDKRLLFLHNINGHAVLIKL